MDNFTLKELKAYFRDKGFYPSCPHGNLMRHYAEDYRNATGATRKPETGLRWSFSQAGFSLWMTTGSEKFHVSFNIYPAWKGYLYNNPLKLRMCFDTMDEARQAWGFVYSLYETSRKV